jgi:glycosyltransferase involved in cell wall biosynthesis
MRIVIDLQGAQSESRFRGIGRYSLALALGVARNAGEHEVWLVLNGALDEAIGAIRSAFDGLIPQHRIRVFDIATPVAELTDGNAARSRAAELLREYFILQLQADAVLVTSLFEGFVDDAATSVGAFTSGATTAVVLYDLIPFLNPAAYLGTPAQQHYYTRKIASLKRAGLLLSISDYSRQEAIDALDLDPARVVSISTAVDARFTPASLAPAALAALRAQFGITRQALMYAPGGFDARKNIDGLITAYSLLPASLRETHQLLIVSKLGEHERAALTEHGKRCGLAPDALILTGYVADATLIDLYRTAALFIFPSKHEGFGLPALEAMACGAVVIGADNTSIPEVIGCPEAMFDAASPDSIAAKIAQVLDDPAMQARLRAHGQAQAARFSWDGTAQRALRALEARFARPPAPAVLLPHGARKRRLAFVSPLPPERTGIADYAVQLLPALMDHFEIELIVQQRSVALPAALAALPQRSAGWFAQNAHRYEQIIYQFGNSPFHTHMFALLQAHPGVVVLHDFFLSGVLAYEQISGAAPGIWAEALHHSHGYPALQASLAPDAIEQAKDAYPCNLAVLEGATRVIVHSEHALSLARSWYGEHAARNWTVVPLPRSAPPKEDRAGARRALGIRPDAFVVCSFGFIAPTKLSHQLLQAWIGSFLHAAPDCELVLVGENHGGQYGAQISETIRAASAGKRIRIAGWSDEQVYRQYLQAADVGVQLRSVSRGETSAAVLDCMNYGLPTIVNANGSMAALPDNSVWKLPDAFALAELSGALEALRRDAACRAALGTEARRLLHTLHSPRHCAQQYAAALEQAYAESDCDRHALVRALTAIPELASDEKTLHQLADCLARAPDPLAPRQLLVDVTAIAQHDLKSGIERVVRTQLIELLRHPVSGFRVEPVYLSAEGGRWHYRYAQRYARQLLGMDDAAVRDPVLDFGPRDVFYSADYSPGAVLEAARGGVYAHWRARGVEVNFLIHDLLPVLRPEFFPSDADLGHGAWLAGIAANADRLICISDAVRQEMMDWLDRHQPEGAKRVKLAVLHHGADIGSGAPAPAALAQVYPLLEQLAAAPSFLMVGTIEPRKGHLQALAAFDKLWDSGMQVNLVIVGNEGWTPLAPSERRTIPEIVERLRRHPQLGKQLFWLPGIDDDYLQQLYLVCACLLAPSEGEGFGLPLIEAARHKLPVLARDLPVFREVAQQHASYFSGLGANDLAGAIRAWLDLHAQGDSPASDAMPWITWAHNAKELLAVLAGQRPERSWPDAP